MAEKGVQILLEVDGRRYELNELNLRPIDELELRKATGWSFSKMMEIADADFGIDVLAAVLWLARRSDGEPNLKLETVMSEISYRSDFRLVDPSEFEDAPPEA